jgi:hypothetical protein
MFQLDIFTWIRFGVWMVIGYLIYFTYSIGNSTEGKRLAGKKIEEVTNKELNDNTMATILTGNEMIYSDKYTSVTYD